MSELTDVEALIIVIFLVILSTVYGINEIKGANQRIRQAGTLEMPDVWGHDGPRRIF